MWLSGDHGRLIKWHQPDNFPVSRQAVAKWKYGQAYPDISNLIQISRLFNVTIDYLVKDQECIVNYSDDNETDIDRLVAFRLEAKKMPFRGPEYYQSGQYIYKCNVVGSFTWFQGYEEIFCNNVKVYEYFFHGRIMK